MARPAAAVVWAPVAASGLAPPLTALSTGFVVDCMLENNVARGGAGAAGAHGGNALAGAIYNGLGTLIVSQSTLTANQSLGGAGGAGADGGSALGGGLYNMGTATLVESTVTRNTAQGGPAGSGGRAGVGVGGGVCNDVDFGATIEIDLLTLIFGNQADVGEDRFGF